MIERAGFEKVNGKEVFFIETPSDATNNVVIMNHGFRGSTIGPAREFVDFTRILNDSGFSVLRFDQPNCGNSEGDFMNVSFNEWVDTTVYFSEKYLNQGSSVVLLGQSMGASVAIVAASKESLNGKISCLLLWVPDPKATFDGDPEKIYEEGGQKYKGKFWKEAAEANIFKCLEDYDGGIHLVYGENDEYNPADKRQIAIDLVKRKSQDAIVLEGQGHSSWDYAKAQQVYEAQLKKLKNIFSN